jgi:hypothetical protein
MENITHADFQKARRISRAIQEYLEYTGSNGLRSTDVYDYLANKGIIEKDRHQGLHFRRFLKKLKDASLLTKLIPQCSYTYSSNGMHEWYFHRSNKEISVTPTDKNENIPHREHFPNMTESEMAEFINKVKPEIENLPKRDKDWTPQQLETRKNYKRAYEIWSAREDELLKEAYQKVQNLDKVAELLQRQPSAVESRLVKLK